MGIVIWTQVGSGFLFNESSIPNCASSSDSAHLAALWQTLFIILVAFPGTLGMADAWQMACLRTSLLEDF